MKRLAAIGFLVFISSSTIALGAEVDVKTPFFSLDSMPELIGFLASVLFAVSIACRGLSEALYIIANKTETKTDDEVAAVLLRVAELTAKVLGMIGFGTPKPLVTERAAALGMVKPDASAK